MFNAVAAGKQGCDRPVCGAWEGEEKIDVYVTEHNQTHPVTQNQQRMS